jgi:hypothetical protein
MRSNTTNKAGTGKNAVKGKSWRRRAVRWLGVVAGALAASIGGKSISKAASDVDAGSAAAGAMQASVSPAWAEFARRLQLQFQKRLASDKEAAIRFHQEMARLAADDRSAAPSVIVKVWVMADGKVERVAMEGSHSDEALQDLSVALAGDGVGNVPVDMPQPLRLRLSLRPKSPAESEP